ncbi:hypothetical protein DHEL01_v200353 [Diaporthe helianthi]|uniref:Uncharacterized protein n=1 Tax=Diaporthe helianthi TaxID=158607 RepID=A0A2P5IFJ3_DIAHE|nr:hypothetical protein DHEL01_v200353 [Diaporthe helianthi]
MSEALASFAPDTEPSSVLAKVCGEPRGQVAHLHRVMNLVRYSIPWVLLTSAGQHSRRIACHAVRSSWRDVPGLLLSNMKITGHHCDFTGARRSGRQPLRREFEVIPQYDDAELIEVDRS